MSAFPSADQVASAMVQSAALFGEDPQLMAMSQRSKGRHVALAALQAAFPDARRRGLARCVGYPKPENAPSDLVYARPTNWWADERIDERIDEIVGALVADDLGEQAA